MNCGRVRKQVQRGFTQLLDEELSVLKAGMINLKEGDTYILDTMDREYACVLIHGKCHITIENCLSEIMGPRKDPFYEKPYAAMVSCEGRIVFNAIQDSLIGIGSAPAREKKQNSFISPEKTGGGRRGADNWEREVRFVCWTDNTHGNMLICGETVTPPGNWSSVPPHRHQYYIPDEEVPYEEAYLFRFSKPEGFGLIWQFDDETNMDQAFSLKNNDAAYISGGYHPLACGPGSMLYHLTFMAGPHRLSRSSVHKDYRNILEERNMENPFAKQYIGNPCEKQEGQRNV